MALKSESSSRSSSFQPNGHRSKVDSVTLYNNELTMNNTFIVFSNILV